MNDKKHRSESYRGKYKIIFNSIPIPAYVWESDKGSIKLTDFNQAAEIITEGKIKNYLDCDISDLYDLNFEVYQDIKKSFDDKLSFSKEMLYEFKSTGKQSILYVTYAFLAPNYVIVYTEDITKQKKAEKLLKKADKEKSIILESISEHIVYQDLDHNVIWTNKAAADSVNSTISDLMGKKCHEIWNKRNTRCPGCPVFEAVKSRKASKGEMKTKDGRVWLIKGYPVLDDKGEVIAAVEVTSEITKIKEAEDDLKKSEERFRRMADNVRDGLSIIENGKTVYVNDRAVEIFGYPKEELMELTGFDVAAPEEKKRLKDIQEKLKQTGQSLSELDFWIVTKDGKRKYIKNRYSWGIKESAKNNRYIITTDFTEYKIAEEKLKDSELQYRNTINSMADAIHVVDKNLKIILHNPATIEWLAYLGFEIDILGKKLDEAFPFLSSEILEEYIQVIDSGKMLITEEKTIIHGKTYFTESRKIPIIIDGVVSQITTIVRDISKRKTSERKLKKSEKKYREAYNRSNFYKDLFAHDINNIFQNIQSSIELLKLQLEELNIDKGHEYIDIIKDQIIRGTNLVSNVRKLSDIEEVESHLKKVEIMKILNDVKAFIIKSFYNKNIKIEIQSDEEKIFLNANELIIDVFENILFNAIRYNRNPEINLIIKVSKNFSKSKYFVKIEFLDNGIGIPDEMKEKIFQRGYNQKGIIKGLGLGLTLVKKIIQLYHGEIWVEDRVLGDYVQGSKFIISIPEAS